MKRGVHEEEDREQEGSSEETVLGNGMEHLRVEECRNLEIAVKGLHVWK